MRLIYRAADEKNDTHRLVGRLSPSSQQVWNAVPGTKRPQLSPPPCDGAALLWLRRYPASTAAARRLRDYLF